MHVSEIEKLRMPQLPKYQTLPAKEKQNIKMNKYPNQGNEVLLPYQVTQFTLHVKEEVDDHIYTSQQNQHVIDIHQ